MSIVEYRKNIL